MDRGSAFGQTCSCSRTFSHLGAFRNHQNNCKHSKRRLSNALAKAKEALAARKRDSIVSNPNPEPRSSVDGDQRDHFIPPQSWDAAPSTESDIGFDEARPKKRVKKLPLRFRVASLQMHDKKLADILPQPAPALPPPGVEATGSGSRASPPLTTLDTTNSVEYGDSGVRGCIRRILDSEKNSFGIFRRYHAEKFPSHDPEGEANLWSMSNIVGANMPRSNTVESGIGHTDSSQVENFGPYPNKSSFRLGEWYWNGDKQKSQHDFKQLLDIVGDEEFQPEDVRTTHWQKINNQLALNNWDKDDWIDDDAGWRSSPVEISVPFDRNTSNPGVREYVVENFHYRPLVSVIREKMSRQCDDLHFHYEPYTLLWQPSGDREIRLHGELYTSPAFIDAHDALQNSPLEPNCELPRVIVALMFWSDATHVTNFGNTKLWPLYMFFGNESKYRRCKPSSNLCEHVAYFERVCLPYLILAGLALTTEFSYQMHSKILQANTVAKRNSNRSLWHTVTVNVFMPNGRFSLMMILYMHMNMAS
jgi:Plavaka transposase